MKIKFTSLLIIAILLISAVSFSSNFALADNDKDKNKKPKTLNDFCSTLDDKNGFPALVCSAILGITNSIQNIQNQINQMQFTAQRCPPGQVMVGIDVGRQIICEYPNLQSSTSVIVTLNPTSVQIPSPPDPHLVPISLAAVGLSPNSHVIVDDGLGHQITTGTTDNNGVFSFSNQPFVSNAFPPGTFTLRVTDANGRTGSAVLTLTAPPPPPPSCVPPQVLNKITDTCINPAVVTITPSSASAGTSVTLTATGLAPNAGVSVTILGGFVIGSGIADASGNFSLTLVVSPSLPLSPVLVTVTDSSGISGSVTFTRL